MTPHETLIFDPARSRMNCQELAFYGPAAKIDDPAELGSNVAGNGGWITVYRKASFNEQEVMDQRGRDRHRGRRRLLHHGSGSRERPRRRRQGGQHEQRTSRTLRRGLLEMREG